MTSLLIIIYIVFISLGLPDSLFGVSWPVVHLDFGVSESFASIYSIITGVCTGGVSFVAGKLIRRFGMNCTPFVRQVWYNTCTKKWGAFYVRKKETNAI